MKFQANNYSADLLTGATNWAEKASTLRAAKFASYAGKALGLAGVAFTTYESLKDGNFSLGDATKVGIGILTTFLPLGWIYAGVDVGFALFTDKSLTDRIGDAIDGK